MSFERHIGPWSEPGYYTDHSRRPQTRFVRPISGKNFLGAIVIWLLAGMLSLAWMCEGIEHAFAIVRNVSHARPLGFSPIWTIAAILIGPSIAIYSCVVICRVARNFWAFECEKANLIYGRRDH